MWNGQIKFPVFSVFLISSSLGFVLLAFSVMVFNCYRCMFPVHYPPPVIIVSPLALKMVFLFLLCPLPPKKCLPKCGIPIPSAMVGDSGDLLQPGEAGEGRNPDCICTSNCPRFKAKSFCSDHQISPGTWNPALRHKLLVQQEEEAPEEHWCDISVLSLLSLHFPAENGFICLLYVVFQLWYFAWRGKFKNLLNFSRHVPFWTLEALTTSSRWPDPCEWCFICCFSWMCHPGPSMLCFSLRLLNSRHVSSLSTLGLASRSVGCSLSRSSVTCLAAVFSFSLGFRQRGDNDFKVLSYRCWPELGRLALQTLLCCWVLC